MKVMNTNAKTKRISLWKRLCCRHDFIVHEALWGMAVLECKKCGAAYTMIGGKKRHYMGQYDYVMTDDWDKDMQSKLGKL